MPRGGTRKGAGRKPGVCSEKRRTQFSCTLPQDVLATLDFLAEKQGKSRSQILEELLTDWFAKPENRLLELRDSSSNRWIDPVSIGIPEHQVQELINVYMESFADRIGDLEKIFTDVALAFYGAIRHGEASRLDEPDEANCGQKDFLAVADLIGRYCTEPVHRLWRDGSWWIVNEKDPALQEFLLADARHRKEEDRRSYE